MRSVVESAEVMADVDEAKEKWARTDAAWATVFWVLSRDPTVGEPLSERGHLRSIVFDGSWAHEMPTIYASTRLPRMRSSFRRQISRTPRQVRAVRSQECCPEHQNRLHFN
jgi:hypothetical protein